MADGSRLDDLAQQMASLSVPQHEHYGWFEPAICEQAHTDVERSLGTRLRELVARATVGDTKPPATLR